MPNLSILTISLLVNVPRPTDVTVNSFDSDRMNISWTAGDAETNWNVKIGEVGFDPEQAGRLITATGDDKDSLDITNLQSNTIYEIYVQADCGSGDVSAWSQPAVCTTKNTVAQVPYTCNFENSNERNAWYFANGNETNTNKWYIGRAQNTNNGGDYGMYISSKNGQENIYDTEGKATIAHAYREFNMPESNSYQLTFDWKSAGAENDYLNVYLLPADQLPVNGQMPDDTYKLNATPFYNNQNLTYSYSTGDALVLIQGIDTLNFNYTGNVQTWTVPEGTSFATLEVWGAQGGGSQRSGISQNGVGGKGGYSRGILPTNGGETLYIYVGGEGNSVSSGRADGGFNGGGSSYASAASEPAGGGGGATDIRVNGNTLYYRVIVAGGGGGGGEDSEEGGFGGGTSGGQGVGGANAPGQQNSASSGAVFGIGASIPV
jgi:hypothetical protein